MLTADFRMADRERTEILIDAPLTADCIQCRTVLQLLLLQGAQRSCEHTRLYSDRLHCIVSLHPGQSLVAALAESRNQEIILKVISAYTPSYMYNIRLAFDII